MVVGRIGENMKFKKYFLFTLILAFVLSITTYSMEKIEIFNIDNEWTIPLPEDWQMEGKSPYQQYYSFYPKFLIILQLKYIIMILKKIKI